MNEVIPRNEVRRHQIGFIESPFFAKVKVERALNDPSSMRGLMELIRQNGISLDDSQLEYHKRRVIEKIDRGEWFLITDKPFKPLSNIELEKHYGFRFTVLSCRSPRIANAKMCLSSGPGRWVTQNVKADVATNALSFAANWLASRGDEGRIFLADGKDYANTFRTIIQEWQPLAYEEEHLKERSVYREFGELREIRQQFVEGDDHWQISGSSWHWRPATADIVYELEGD